MIKAGAELAIVQACISLTILLYRTHTVDLTSRFETGIKDDSFFAQGNTAFRMFAIQPLEVSRSKKGEHNDCAEEDNVCLQTSTVRWRLVWREQ